MTTSAGQARGDETALLKLASEGDETAFSALVGAYRGELQAHCYRMLGWVHDAEDALQDALLRAWRGLPGFQGRSSVRTWLYSIATNTALDITRRRSRRELPVSFGPAAPQGADLDPAVHDPIWLEPYPDRWLTGTAGVSPEARYAQRESVELAFVVALQQLPPLQRAVLILREVMGFSSADIASQLGTSVPAVNSALQRARATVQRHLPARSQQSALRDLGNQRSRALVQRYTDAMERGDAGTLVSMLTEDATWSMPPIPTWFRGIPSIHEFLTSVPLTERWKHHPAQGNGQLAVGCYLWDSGRGGHVPAVIDVLTLDGDRISSVTGFLMEAGGAAPEAPGAARATAAEVFARFGLPEFLP